jgi:hypothetical protein
MNTYGAVEVKLQEFFALRIIISLTPLLLHSKLKSHGYPLGRRLAGPQTGLDMVVRTKS